MTRGAAAIHKAILKQIQDMEEREGRKLPKKTRKLVIQGIYQSRITELRRKYGVDENTGKALGETLTDFFITE